jgi:hypothetical protein
MTVEISLPINAGKPSWALVVGVVDEVVDTASLRHKLMEAWLGVSVLPAHLVDELGNLISSASSPVRPQSACFPAETSVRMSYAGTGGD